VGNTTPGIFTSPIYLTGPHAFFDSISVSKIYPITERWKFSIQAELLNAFNHPVFNGTIGGNVRSSSWAETSSGGSFGRQIELRGNITF
jgi:hypothetical protein